MAEDEKLSKKEPVQIDRQKIVKGVSKAGSAEEKTKGAPVEVESPEAPKPGRVARFWRGRAVFSTLTLFAVGTVWLGIGISEYESLGIVLGGIFLLAGFLAAVSTFVRKSA